MLLDPGEPSADGDCNYDCGSVAGDECGCGSMVGGCIVVVMVVVIVWRMVLVRLMTV